MPVTNARRALLRALENALPNHLVNFVNLHSRKWASCGVTGVRHRIEILVSGPGAAAEVGALLGGLGSQEFDLGRFILADISATCTPAADDTMRLTVEALTTDND